MFLNYFKMLSSKTKEVAHILSLLWFDKLRLVQDACKDSVQVFPRSTFRLKVRYSNCFRCVEHIICI